MEFDTTKTLKAFYWDIHGYTSVFVTEVGPHRIEDFSSWWNHFLQQNGPRIFQHNNIHNCQNNQDNKPPSCDIDSSRLECNSIVWGVVHEGIRDDEVFVHLLMYWMFDLVPCAYISEFSGSWKPNFQKRCHSFLVRENYWATQLPQNWRKPQTFWSFDFALANCDLLTYVSIIYFSWNASELLQIDFLSEKVLVRSFTRGYSYWRGVCLSFPLLIAKFELHWPDIFTDRIFTEWCVKVPMEIRHHYTGNESISSGTLEAIKVKMMLRGADYSPHPIRLEMSSENDLFFHFSHGIDGKDFHLVQEQQKLVVV